MKLYILDSSPFARMTRITWREKGGTPCPTEIHVNPFRRPAELMEANPLGEVPVLVCEDGTAILDSTVICDWMNAQSSNHPLLPGNPQEMWATLSVRALGLGVSNALVSAVLEQMRPQQEQSERAIERAQRKALRGVERMKQALDSLPAAEICTARIACLCALYFADSTGLLPTWRADDPDLADWLDSNYGARASVLETAPQAK